MDIGWMKAIVEIAKEICEKSGLSETSNAGPYVFIAKHGHELVAAVNLAEATTKMRMTNMIKSLPRDETIMVWAQKLADDEHAIAADEFNAAIEAYNNAKKATKDAEKEISDELR